MEGFGDLLSPAEESILRCFKTGKLVYPSVPGLTIPDTNRALNSLTKRGIVKGRAPYELTRKGVKLYKQYSDRRLQQDAERKEGIVPSVGGD